MFRNGLGLPIADVLCVKNKGKKWVEGDNENTFFDNLITMDELLRILKYQYSKQSIYKWVQRKNMPHKRIRGRLWFPQGEVFLWLEKS